MGIQKKTIAQRLSFGMNRFSLPKSNRVKIFFILFFLWNSFVVSFLFTSCEKNDLSGFFASNETPDFRFDQSMEWNNVHGYKEITVPKDDYMVFAMGDSHLGGSDNLDYFLKKAKEDSAAAVIMAGDLTSGKEADLKNFHAHMPHPDSLNTFPIAGNHDLFYNGWKTYAALFGTSTYYFTVKTPVATDLYICLESGGGTLGPKQFAWFKKFLADERHKYRNCIVSTHNNFIRSNHTTSTNPQEEELIELFSLSVEYNINMWITGHDHDKSHVTFGKTEYITMDALLDDYPSQGYFTVQVLKGVLNYKFVNF